MATMMAVPKMVTSAIAVATSAGRRRTPDSMAAMAAAPQTENSSHSPAEFAEDEG